MKHWTIPKEYQNTNSLSLPFIDLYEGSDGLDGYEEAFS